MTKQQDALRIAGRFLRLQAMGFPVSRDECKTIADLCFIVLPMKYRLSRDDIESMKNQLADRASTLQ